MVTRRRSLPCFILLHLFLLPFMSLVVRIVVGQPPPPANTCQDASVLSTASDLPFQLPTGSLVGRPVAGPDNPAFSCPIYTNLNGQADVPVVWYEIIDNDSISTCLCLELRSFDNAFIVGLLRDDTTSSGGSTICENLTCLGDTDFTSESLVWRADSTNPRTLVALSVLNNNLVVGGTFDVTIVVVGDSVCPDPPSGFTATRVPGSCADLPTRMPTTTTPVPVLQPSRAPFSPIPTTPRPIPTQTPIQRKKRKRKTKMKMKRNRSRNKSRMPMRRFGKNLYAIPRRGMRKKRKHNGNTLQVFHFQNPKQVFYYRTAPKYQLYSPFKRTHSYSTYYDYDENDGYYYRGKKRGAGMIMGKKRRIN